MFLNFAYSLTFRSVHCSRTKKTKAMSSGAPSPTPFPRSRTWPPKRSTTSSSSSLFSIWWVKSYKPSVGKRSLMNRTFRVCSEVWSFKRWACWDTRRHSPRPGSSYTFKLILDIRTNTEIECKKGPYQGDPYIGTNDRSDGKFVRTSSDWCWSNCLLAFLRTVLLCIRTRPSHNWKCTLY